MVKLDWHQTVNFVRRDWKENPLRLILESINWILNLTIGLIFAFTVPNVPLILCYSLFLIAISISIYSSISRGSFGLLATSITIFIIDLVTWIKLLYS
jgi:hypothetical protein